MNKRRLKTKHRHEGQRRLEGQRGSPEPAIRSADLGPQRSKAPVRLPHETEVTHKMILPPVVERRLNTIN